MDAFYHRISCQHGNPGEGERRAVVPDPKLDSWVVRQPITQSAQKWELTEIPDIHALLAKKFFHFIKKALGNWMGAVAIKTRKLFEQLTLFVAQFHRSFNHNAHQLVASAATT